MLEVYISDGYDLNVFVEGFSKLAAGCATISMAGAGAGVGVVFGSLQLAASRNFAKKDDLFNYALLGFALTEAVGLLGFMMAMLLLYG